MIHLTLRLDVYELTGVKRRRKGCQVRKKTIQDCFNRQHWVISATSRPLFQPGLW